MKKYIVLLSLVSALNIGFSQDHTQAFQKGEWFQFKMSYSNWLRAGTATLKVDENIVDGKPVYHVTGQGWTTGAIKWFFKVDDHYESYFDKSSGLPYRYVRKIYEGGYTKDLEVSFNQEKQKAYVVDNKHKKEKEVDLKVKVQDAISVFYYFRNNYDTKSISPGHETNVAMYFDEEVHNFKLKYLGTEIIKTSFGKVKTLKFRPYVLAGRAFKEEESLTLWVSADENKIPLRISADLAVGSLRADLEEFKGLAHPFQIQIE